MQCFAQPSAQPFMDLTARKVRSGGLHGQISNVIQRDPNPLRGDFSTNHKLFISLFTLICGQTAQFIAKRPDRNDISPEWKVGSPIKWRLTERRILRSVPTLSPLINADLSRRRSSPLHLLSCCLMLLPFVLIIISCSRRYFFVSPLWDFLNPPW